ncbi:MAG: hypothetical protein ACFFAS_15895 [Promethearchaeota archaeon]
MEDNRYQSRALSRKLLAVCPRCNKQIFGQDINIVDIDKSKIRHWPITYIYCHSGDNGQFHALTMYIDASFTVRAREVSDHLKIQEEFNQ